MQYEIAKNSRQCAVSGRAIGPGEVYYSVLLDTVTGFERRDYAQENWNGPPPEAIGFWRGRIPVGGESNKPKPVSAETMLELFERLADKNEESAQRLKYVLALLLLRRKALKLQGMERTPQGDVLLVRPPHSKETVYQVLDTGLSEEQMGIAEAELAELLENAQGT